MRPIQGTIPDKITYVYRGPQQISTGWYEIEDKIHPDFEAHPAFPVDAASENSLSTAEVWAKGGGYGNKPPPKRPANVTVDNTPIAAVTITSLEIRNEGGRAYKVLIPGIHPVPFVDLREDVFLDAMLVNGVGKGGHLKGPFVWGRVHTTLKLVRVGSALHAALMAAKNRNAKRTVGKRELVVGTVYKDRQMVPYLYLGRFDADAIDYEHWHKYVYRYRYSNVNKVNVYKRVEHRNKQLWLRLSYCGDEKKTDFQKDWRERISGKGASLYGFELVGTKAVIEPSGTVDLGKYSGKLPSLLRELFDRRLQERFEDYRQKNYNRSHPEEDWIYHSGYTTIREAGTAPPPVPGELAKLFELAAKETT